jgi:6-pyruvoyl-tetrahydropterin synthase
MEVICKPTNPVLSTWKTADSMVMEYATFKAFLNSSLDRYDHVNLNDLFPEATCEAFAEALYRDIAILGFEIKQLTLMETDNFGVVI